MKYLGVTLDTTDHQYKNWTVVDSTLIDGSTRFEILANYLISTKVSDCFDPNGIFDVTDTSFKYHDENRVIYFIKLPDENYNPDVLGIDSAVYVPKLHIDDTLYLTRTESELRYHGCCFIPNITDTPIERKVISITITRDGVKYQLSGCGVHITEDCIGKFAFTNYDDAVDAIKRRYNRSVQ